MLANHDLVVIGRATGTATSSNTFLQPFLSYTTQKATSFTASTPKSTYNWETEEWSVPINLTVAQIIKISGKPVQLTGGVRYWADSPEGGARGLGRPPGRDLSLSEKGLGAAAAGALPPCARPRLWSRHDPPPDQRPPHRPRSPHRRCRQPHRVRRRDRRARRHGAQGRDRSSTAAASALPPASSISGVKIGEPGERHREIASARPVSRRRRAVSPRSSPAPTPPPPSTRPKRWNSSPAAPPSDRRSASATWPR